MGRLTDRVSERLGTVVTLGLLVLIAIGLRGYRLASPVLEVDEAESALNALTIVADGVPGDHFLGQPLYENTLVRPWPENSEYEFRDISYSDRGLAVYHSWLPLYSIAGAFRLAGVTSDLARHGTPLRDASSAEIDYWTAVPRMPAVVFSAILVVGAWYLGLRVHSYPAAIALAFAAATSNFFVYAGRMARYYSATLAGSALCGLAIWNAWRRGRLSDHALAGLAVGVLFHIHSVSAVAMSALYVAAAPMGRRQSRLWLRVLTAGSVGAALVFPWAIWSGLLSQASWMPAARDYIDLPLVLWSLPSTNPIVWAELVVGLVWFAVVTRRGRYVSDRWRQPIVDASAGIYFAAAWMVVSYLCFLMLMPAASFFPYRLKLVVAVPSLLVMTLFAAALSRSVWPAATYLPVAGLAAVLVVSGQLPPNLSYHSLSDFPNLVGVLREWPLAPDGRIFASPNDHLILTYYSGRPVQSIAPVRREWLDRFASDLLIVEGLRYSRPGVTEVQKIARRQGRMMNEIEAQSRALDASQLATGLDLQMSGAYLVSPPRMPDGLDQALVDLVHEVTRMDVMNTVKGTPLGIGQTLATHQDVRDAFFYWFSNPHLRTGAGLNYRACRARAHTYLHSSGFALLDCRVNREIPLPPMSIAPVSVRP